MGQETFILPLAALLPARRNAAFAADSFHAILEWNVARRRRAPIANASMSG